MPDHMMLINGEKYGAAKVVQKPEDAPGWELIAVIDASYEALEQSYDHDGKVAHVVSQTDIQFLFGLPRDETIHSLNHEKDQAVDAKMRAEEKLKACEEKSDEFRRSAAEESSRIRLLEKELESEQTHRRKLRDKFNDMEHDLGTLREHLGTANMKELLGHD